MNKKEEIFRFLALFLWTFLGDFILLLTTPVEANAMWDDKLTIGEVYGTLCANKRVLFFNPWEMK